MIKVKSDVSALIKQLGALTRGPNSIYRRTGRELKAQLIEDFTILVRETPQWTGTTAASWEIGFPSRLTGEVKEQPERTRAEALQKGSEAACAIALSWADKTISDDFGEIATQGIILSNDAPGFDRAEEGPVRPENTPPGALKRFEARILTMPDIEVDLNK